MDKKSSALHEKEGVSKPETTNKTSAEKIKFNRAKQNSVNDFVTNILVCVSRNLSYHRPSIPCLRSKTQPLHICNLFSENAQHHVPQTGTLSKTDVSSIIRCQHSNESISYATSG